MVYKEIYCEIMLVMISDHGESHKSVQCQDCYDVKLQVEVTSVGEGTNSVV